jgi:hypothetical protein
MKTPSKYDSIIDAEYERYKEDCGLKIGDHKILCKVFDAQDDNLQRILSQGYDVQAVAITDSVREILNEFKAEVFERFDKLDHRITCMEIQLKEVTKTIDCTKEEIENIKMQLNKLKRVNTWWHIAGRWVTGVIVAVWIAYYLYTNFWHK